MNRITLRAATPADIPLLRYWDSQPHIIAAKTDADWQWENELTHAPQPWRQQLIACIGSSDGNGGKDIGFVQIIDPAADPTHYWGETIAQNLRAVDIWIGEPDCLGKGYGTQIMQPALARCFQPPQITAVIIDPLAANTRAIRFYTRLGFEFWRRQQFGTDNCTVMKLPRQKWQAQQQHTTAA